MILPLLMEQYNASSSHGSVALVVGATGMVGRSLVEALKKPNASGGPWTVYGVARRRAEPSGIPLPGLDQFIQLDVLDRESTLRTLSALAPRVTHLFWVALAVLDDEEKNVEANTAMLANVVDALASAGAPSSSPSLRHVALQTGSKHYYLGQLLDPDRAGRLGPLEVPFREESPRLEGPCFYYALEDLLAAYSDELGLSWTVHRASLIFGASSRSIYNALLTLATYAAISRHEGSSRLVYPGSAYTWLHFCDASDAELLAEQQVWAATAADGAARNQAFNCTNGDVFTWRSFWGALAGAFGLDSEGPAAAAAMTAADEGEADTIRTAKEGKTWPPLTGEGEGGWASRMKGKGEVWEDIVRRNGLVRTRLEEITCYDAVFAVLNLRFQHVSSMNKSREFGFCKTVDTLKSLRKWLGRLADLKIIPKVYDHDHGNGKQSPLV